MWCTLVTRKCKTISQIIPFYIISLNTFFFTKYRKQYKNYLGIYIQLNVLVHWPSFVLNNACIFAPTRILKELTLLTVSWIEIFSSNVRLRHPVRLVYAVRIPACWSLDFLYFLKKVKLFHDEGLQCIETAS